MKLGGHVLMSALFACGGSACGSSPAVPSGTPPSSPAAPPAAALAFGPYVTLRSETAAPSGGGEPTLQIGRDGRLWVTDVVPAQIWTSSDRGATWTFNAPALSIGDGDMDAAPDDGGRVHVVDLEQTGHCVFYYRSTDFGRTFDIVQAAHDGMWVPGDGGCPRSSTTRVDRPWVSAWGSTVYIVSKDETTAGTAGVDVSFDSGQTFTHAPKFAFPEAQGMAIDPVDGTLYVIGEEAAHFDSTLGRSVFRIVRVASSKDGRAFTSAQVFDGQQFDVAAGGFATIAVDAGHNVYAAWSDNSAGTTDVYISVSRDRGVTWSAPIRIGGGLTLSVYATIVAGDAGRVAVAWYGTADPAKASNDAHGTTWYVYAAVSTNALDRNPTFETVKVSDRPFHHNSISAHVNVCEGVELSGGHFPDGYEPRILDFFRAAIDPTGALNVIWVDTTAPVIEDHFARQVSGPPLRTAAALPAVLTEKIVRINTLARQSGGGARETTIGESELNTYLPRLLRDAVSPALLDVSVTLHDANRLTLRAILDGTPRLPVVVDGTLVTRGGTAALAVDAAMLDRAPAPPAALQRALAKRLSPDAADWHLGDPFQLPAGIRELRIARGRLTVVQ
jgi:hypothetical protein